MTILDTIVAHKRLEVRSNTRQYPVSVLKRSPFFGVIPYSMRASILNPSLTGIIAEFKRRSPSKGDINPTACPDEVCPAYAMAGASALSVLTDQEFFGGSNNDLALARRFTSCPILRKDFIVDKYQIIEARSIGADAILLIAEVLTAEELSSLYAVARDFGMEVLFEVHDTESIEKLPSDAQLVGINNRNLKDFRVDLEHSARLLELLPSNAVKVAESGIDSPETLNKLRTIGFDAFLIGERFMREENPGRTFEIFVKGMERR